MNLKHKCRAKQRHRRCPNSTYFIYCKEHWSDWKRATKSIIGGLLMIFGVYKAIIYFYEDWKAETRMDLGVDNKNRGTVLENISYDPNKPANVALGKIILGFVDPIGEQEACISLGDGNPEEITSSCNITISAKDGNLMFSMKIYDVNGNFIGEIVENEIVYDPYQTFSYNYDKHGFELIDNHNNVLINMLSMGNNLLSFQGVIMDNVNVARVVVEHEDLHTGDTEFLRKKQSAIKKQFIYTGDYFGKRSDFGKKRLNQEFNITSLTRIRVPKNMGVKFGPNK